MKIKNTRSKNTLRVRGVIQDSREVLKSEFRALTKKKKEKRPSRASRQGKAGGIF